jgi:hypothetical protein
MMTMVWWQTLLAVWGIGAVGAFPVSYQFSEARLSVDDLNTIELPLHWKLPWVILCAALWPVAWVMLILYAIRKALPQ